MQKKIEFNFELFKEIIGALVENNVTDMHIAPGTPPFIRQAKELKVLRLPGVDTDTGENIIASIKEMLPADTRKIIAGVQQRIEYLHHCIVVVKILLCCHSCILLIISNTVFFLSTKNTLPQTMKKCIMLSYKKVSFIMQRQKFNSINPRKSA